MLMQRPIKKGSVISIKIMTGEEIIARLEEESEDGIIVSKASVVAPNPQGGLGLVPWMMSSAPDKLTFNSSSIVAYSATVDEIADKFTEATSEIQIAK